LDSDKDGIFDYYESMDKYETQYEISDLQQSNTFGNLFSKLWADTEDMDNDGLTNGVKDPDTDGDGYLDGDEVRIRVYYKGVEKEVPVEVIKEVKHIPNWCWINLIYSIIITLLVCLKIYLNHCQRRL
jgi:hypothetical protein